MVLISRVVLIALYLLRELNDFLREEVVMVEVLVEMVGGVEVEVVGVEQREDYSTVGIP